MITRETRLLSGQYSSLINVQNYRRTDYFYSPLQMYNLEDMKSFHQMAGN